MESSTLKLVQDTFPFADMTNAKYETLVFSENRHSITIPADGFIILYDAVFIDRITYSFRIFNVCCTEFNISINYQDSIVPFDISNPSLYNDNYVPPISCKTKIGDACNIRRRPYYVKAGVVINIKSRTLLPYVHDVLFTQPITYMNEVFIIGDKEHVDNPDGAIIHSLTVYDWYSGVRNIIDNDNDYKFYKGELWNARLDLWRLVTQKQSPIVARTEKNLNNIKLPDKAKIVYYKTEKIPVIIGNRNELIIEIQDKVKQLNDKEVTELLKLIKK